MRYEKIEDGLGLLWRNMRQAVLWLTSRRYRPERRYMRGGE